MDYETTINNGNLKTVYAMECSKLLIILFFYILKTKCKLPIHQNVFRIQFFKDRRGIYDIHIVDFDATIFLPKKYQSVKFFLR